MAGIKEGIIISKGDKISFGDYTVAEKFKAKADNFGDEYSVKTHKDVTRLEKNGGLLIETVPGATIRDFHADERRVTFSAEGVGNTQITLELLPETEYRLNVDDFTVGRLKSNVGGKVIFGAELSDKPIDVVVELCG